MTPLFNNLEKFQKLLHPKPFFEKMKTYLKNDNKVDLLLELELL
jgi:hypothetical protein